MTAKCGRLYSVTNCRELLHSTEIFRADGNRGGELGTYGRHPSSDRAVDWMGRNYIRVGAEDVTKDYAESDGRKAGISGK